MSSEIVPLRPAQIVSPPSARDTVDGWLPMFEPVARLAAEIAQTEFIPAGLRGKPAAITAAILYGREIGLGPIQSLQSVDVIDGRPAISAEMGRALALAAGHELFIEESTTARCVVRGRRSNSREWVTITWTLDDAKRAGLEGRKNWRTHPRRMLQARATSELCHLLFADAIGGMPFTVEEIEDDSDAAGQVGADGGGRTARRARPPRAAATLPASAGEESAAQAGAEPPLPGEAGYDGTAAAGEADETGDGITQPQVRKINATFRDLGVSERPERLEITAALVGRAIETSKDLTKDEAGTLIETLEKVSGGPDPAARLKALVAASKEAAADAGEAKADGAQDQGALPVGDESAPPAHRDPAAGEG